MKSMSTTLSIAVVLLFSVVLFPVPSTAQNTTSCSYNACIKCFNSQLALKYCYGSSTVSNKVITAMANAYTSLGLTAPTITLLNQYGARKLNEEKSPLALPGDHDHHHEGHRQLRAVTDSDENHVSGQERRLPPTNCPEMCSVSVPYCAGFGCLSKPKRRLFEPESAERNGETKKETGEASSAVERNLQCTGSTADALQQKLWNAAISGYFTLYNAQSGNINKAKCQDAVLGISCSVFVY